MNRPLPTTDHERSATVEIAAQRAAEMPVMPSARDLQHHHGLSSEQAAEAIAMARRMRTLRSAFS